MVVALGNDSTIADLPERHKSGFPANGCQQWKILLIVFVFSLTEGLSNFVGFFLISWYNRQ